MVFSNSGLFSGVFLNILSFRNERIILIVLIVDVDAERDEPHQQHSSHHQDHVYGRGKPEK